MIKVIFAHVYIQFMMLKNHLGSALINHAIQFTFIKEVQKREYNIDI